jgi:hypothetical protein
LPTAEKVIAKFRHLTARVAGIDAERVLETVLRMERLASVHELTKLLASNVAGGARPEKGAES